ncbi:MAG: oligosaccharide flippase family protein, partial [Balneolales bacterium]
MQFNIKIKSKIADVIKKPFLRDVATVSAGSIIAQITAVASAPILTRLFLPDDFGILAVFVSSSAILAVIYTLQFDMAIVLPQNDMEARKLFVLSVKLSLWFLVILAILASFVLIFPILEFVGFEEIPQYLPLLAVLGGFAIAIERSLNYWNIRHKLFQLISIALAVAALLAAAFNITLGLFTTGVWILILGSLLNHFVNILIQMVYSKDREVFKDYSSKVTDQIKPEKLFNEYSDFPK